MNSNFLVPKKRKNNRRKAQRGTLKGLSSAGSTLSNGDYGLRVLQSGYITSNQLEAVRVAARKATNRSGSIMFKVCASHPVSGKPLEVRMGSGKGPIKFNVAKVRAGKIIFELCGVNEKTAFEAFNKARHKLGLKSSFVRRIGV